MENYIIELKLNNEENSDEEITYDELSIKILFKQNNILIASFYTNFKYFNEKFVNKFDPKKEKDCFNFHDCNGSVLIIKNDNYLTFNTSIFGGRCYGEIDFTVLITNEIFLMIEKIKIIKKNL